jgi:hypothetical protein
MKTVSGTDKKWLGRTAAAQCVGNAKVDLTVDQMADARVIPVARPLGYRGRIQNETMEP